MVKRKSWVTFMLLVFVSALVLAAGCGGKRKFERR